MVPKLIQVENGIEGLRVVERLHSTKTKELNTHFIEDFIRIDLYDELKQIALEQAKRIQELKNESKNK